MAQPRARPCGARPRPPCAGRERARDEAQADDAQRRAHCPKATRSPSPPPPARGTNREDLPRRPREAKGPPRMPSGHEPHAPSEAAARIRRARADVDDPRAGGTLEPKSNEVGPDRRWRRICASRRNTGGFVNQRARSRRGAARDRAGDAHRRCHRESTPRVRGGPRLRPDARGGVAVAGADSHLSRGRVTPFLRVFICNDRLRD